MMGKLFRTDYMALLYCLYAAGHLLVGGAAASPEFIFKWGAFKWRTSALILQIR